ncbi:ATP/GTP-binding protein [Streptomyces sp. NPDC059874]|uniref:ATP/GTP-binding protein n=1 Tax=Streptomyces sp. NPDC059874 TaxID=3346983 RepID=UPI0036513A40
MDTEGTHDGRSTRAGHVPRPSVPPRPVGAPPKPLVPPSPAHVPAQGPELEQWLSLPRVGTDPGVWRTGPTGDAARDAVNVRQLRNRAILTFLGCVLVWRITMYGSVPWSTYLLLIFTPGDWWDPYSHLPVDDRGAIAMEVYEVLLTAGLVFGFARLGNWRTAFERVVADQGRRAAALGATLGALLVVIVFKTHLVKVEELVLGHVPWREIEPATGAVVMWILYAVIYLPVIVFFVRLADWSGRGRAAAAEAAAARAAAQPVRRTDLTSWAELRAAGLAESAERLEAEIKAGRMNDVDYTRIRRAWESVQADPSRLRAFADAVRDKGAAACAHPSGARDLPVRAARHDLLVRQVRLGTVEDEPRNPYARRGTGLALDPDVLGTSLLAVGPSGAGKTGRLVRPVVESLALQALAGQAAVVAVGAAGAQLGPDGAYDVVVRVGDPGSVYDLDLYGGTTDPDEAATLLAEAFVGEVPGIEVRRAATALAQLLGPFRAAYGRFPAVPELRELLDQVPDALAGLRRALEDAGAHAMLRELDARERQYGSHGDPGPALADRVALLDRPAFAGFFDTTGQGRPFSLRALEHPIRVRVDLPERGHADASRMLARLLLAQFNAAAAARTDRSLFAFLAFDDASHTLTAETVRGVQRLRSANAGVLLTLRTLDDVPEALRTPLLGAVGCRMAFSGVTTWDGKRFAEAWGTEWVETRDVTHRTVFADQPLTRAIHAFRKLVTGKAVTTDAVTVRQVERERWSASDLAHAVPPGSAVLSLTSVRGERAAPLLVRLAGSA